MIDFVRSKSRKHGALAQLIERRIRIAKVRADSLPVHLEKEMEPRRVAYLSYFCIH